jgi:CheY-like chemotaxis protein
MHGAKENELVEDACQNMRVCKKLIKPLRYPTLIDALQQMSDVHWSLTTRPASVEPSPNPHTTEQHILLVDDNPVNIMLTKALLGKLMPAATITEATNGREAVEAFAKNPADIVLMDVQMPEMNGYEAAREIRQLPQGADILILALTAGTIKGEKERCLEAGMNDYLAKPITQKSLGEALKRNLDEENSSEPSIENPNLHFHRANLNSRMGGDQELMREIMEISKTILRDSAAALVEALENAELTRIKQEAHKLKGTALNMCMPSLVKLANDLEKSEDFDKDHLLQKISKLQKEIALIYPLLSPNG